MTLQWTSGTSLPAARNFHAVGVVSGTVYVVGGYDANGNLTSTVYTSTGGAWSTGPAYPIVVADASAATLSGVLYVIGGYSNNTGNVTNVYKLVSGAWQAGPSLPVALAHTCAVVVGSTLYVIGGYNNSNDPVSTVYKLVGSSWESAPSLITPLSGSAAVVDHDNTIWVMGGTMSTTPTPTPEARVYTLEQGVGNWQETFAWDLPQQVVFASAAVGYDGSIYLLGGLDVNPSAAVYQFPPGGSSWQTATQLPAVVAEAGAAVPDGKTIWLIGGISGNGSNPQPNVYKATTITAPAAPTLTFPTSGSYVDVSAGVSFAGTYNSTDGAYANARALRIRAVGGAYQYWNAATSALQSSIVWNPVSIAPGNSGTFDITGLSNTTTYNWSMADQETFGNMQGVFASDATLNAQSGPSVVVNEPSGTAITNTPVVTWTATPGSGASITNWEAKVFTYTQTQAGGFSPASSTPVWDSGVQPTSGPPEVTVGTALTTGVTYVFYVQVTETGSLTSSWVSSTATISVDPPADPTITAAAGTGPNGLPVINLTIQGHDNMFDADTASFEGSTGTWSPGLQWTIAQDLSGHALDGEASLSCTRNATGVNGYAETGVFAVVDGAQYVAWVSILSTASTAGLQYAVTVSDAYSTLGSQTVTLNPAGGWLTVSINFTGSAHQQACIIVSDSPQASPAVNQLIYIDEAGIFPAPSSVWTRGGLVGSGQFIITRSDGVEVRGASTSNPATVATSTQQVIVMDAEVIPTVEYSWSVVETVPVSATQTLISNQVSSGQAAVAGAQGWWEFDPTDLTTAVAAQVTSYNPQITEQATAHLVLGQVTPNVIASVMGGVDGTATFETFDAATYQGLTTLLLSQQTIFMSDPFGDNQGVTYVRFGPESGAMSSGSGVKTKSANLQQSGAVAPHHTVDVNWVAQPRPAV